jgi:two-component system NtrC family sensor kinase
MTALSKDRVADLRRTVAELEQKLQSNRAERDQAIARQAAVAAENTRLQNELATARDRQAGSAEILRAIARTSGDPEQSLQQIAETTARLFGAPGVTIRIAEGDEWVRTIRVGASAQRIAEQVPAAQRGSQGKTCPARCFARTGRSTFPTWTISILQ